MVKATTIDPVLLSSLRLLGAALVLTPLFIKDIRKDNLPLNWKLVSPSIIPGIFMGLHFITWIIGARLTLAANSTLVVNMMPVVMPFVIYILKREIITLQEIIGTLIAVTGIVVLAMNDFRTSPETFTGDMLCIVSMVFYAIYLGLARKHRGHGGIFRYIVPLYYAGGLFCLVAALFNPGSFSGITGRDLRILLLLIFIPTIAGHTTLNYTMRVLRSQIVTLVNLSQFIFAGALAFFIFREVPEGYFYPAAAFIIAGAVYVIVLGKNQDKSQDKVIE